MKSNVNVSLVKSPINKSKLLQGFTMIELLVVLAIVATVIGLVGPLTIESIGKYQSKVEMVEVKAVISRFSNIAFLRGERVHLIFREHSITKEKDGEIEDSFTFDNLYFYPTELSFNQSGVPDISEIKLVVEEKEIKIDVFEVVYDTVQ